MDKITEANRLAHIPEDVATPRARPVPAAAAQPATRGGTQAVAKAVAKVASRTASNGQVVDNRQSGPGWLLSATAHPANLLRSIYLRGIDASYSLLLRLRRRIAPPTRKDGQNRPARNVGNEERPVQAIADTKVARNLAAVVESRSTWRGFLIGLLAAVSCGIAGMVFSYTLYSAMIVNQAQKIEAQMDKIARLEKQLAKIQTSEARYRNENLAYQKRLEEMEMTLASKSAAREKTPSGPSTNSTPIATKRSWYLR